MKKNQKNSMNKITTEKNHKNSMNKITTKNHKNSMKKIDIFFAYEHTNICILNNNITKKSMNRKNSNFCIFIYEQITTTQLTTHLN